MKKIKTKFSLGQLFGMPILILGLFFGVGALLLSDKFQEDSSESISIWGVITLFSVGVFFLYFQLKHLKQISIENKGISIKTIFKKKCYSWEEIKFINLLSSESLLSQKSLAIKIKLENGKNEIFFDLFYANMPEFRRFLRAVMEQIKNAQPVNLEKISLPKEKYRPVPSNLKTFKSYGGAMILSTGGFLFSFVALAIIYTLFTSPYSISRVIFLLVILIFCLLVLKIQFHVFYINKHFLVVKNVIFFWQKHTFLISEIKEIQMVLPPISTSTPSKGIRITTKNFKSRSFGANNLSQKTWNLLRTELTKRKIRVF